MAEFNDWRIENTTEKEREILFNSGKFDYYYDGLSSTVLIDGSKEEFEEALKLIGRQ